MKEETTLPAIISEGLDAFLNEAKKSFGESLVSAVLFGSAAEGRLRPTSDVNLLLLLKRFDLESADKLRPQMRTAHAAFRLSVMFLLEQEILHTMDAFALKFSDILARRRVLFGPDPFANLTVSAEAVCRRTRQVLMNLMLRMRERYVMVSMREEQIALVLADMTGPLRAAAQSILKLEGRTARSPKEAMDGMLTEIQGQKAEESIRLIDMIRRQQEIPHGAVSELLLAYIDLAGRMYERIDKCPACKGEGSRV